ncbi:MAG: glycoside hydrolase family 3 N-terminal domain-containing protein, partial [Ignavibacteria bacterium]
MTKYLLLKRIIFFPFTFIFIFLFADVINPQVYLDSTADVESRIEDLLSRMNLDEKIGQMAQAERSAVTGNSDITTYFLGSILSGGGSVPGGNNAESWINMYETFQTQALDTRLKIPIIYGIDAVHGHNNVRNAVIFPHNIGLGCARDSELVRQAASITAKEIMGTGLNW